MNGRDAETLDHDRINRDNNCGLSRVARSTVGGCHRDGIGYRARGDWRHVDGNRAGGFGCEDPARKAEGVGTERRNGHAPAGRGEVAGGGEDQARRQGVRERDARRVEGLAFVIANVREVVPPTGMDETPNAFPICGANVAALAGPARMSAAASHIIGMTHFPAKRRVQHARNIRRLEICTLTSRGI